MKFRATRRGRLVAIGSVTAAAVAGLPLTAGPATAAAGETAPQEWVSVAPTEPVTLITGDTVTLHEGEDGAPVVEFTAARRDTRGPVSYISYGDGEHFYVIPSDVATLVPEQLDLRLFDVKGLAQVDEDDGIPVIVQSTESTDAEADAAEWKALDVDPERTLESIDAVSGELPADGAPELIEAAAADVVEKVWLDAPVEALDTVSAPQIGAPDAWASGYYGTGTVVAIVDSGIDTTHPDLDDGVVIAEKDFTGSGSATDERGHGTHVAGIVAGTGEASGGDILGIAHGAKLLNARVLDAQGSGQSSWIIDGMEWAAEQGADVINMSLGLRGAYTDGKDPSSLAVDSVSERYDALVVIAAGNEGELGATTVTTPGTADSALTVGAVDENNQLGYFSAQGPRFGNAGIKPDVTGPGANILSARAAGAFPDLPAEHRYVYNGGTSMAAPHVAAAAAVLKSARPDLDGEQLKAVLMGTAKQTVGNVWQEGAGLVTIPTAITQPLYAEPASLSFGVFLSPRESQAPRAMALEYTNTSDADLTLYLAPSGSAADGSPLPPGALTLSSDTVTVPARGTASVDVTVDSRLNEPGLYTGRVTAAGPGFAPVHTVLGYQIEQDSATLHLSATATDGGTPLPTSLAWIYDIDDPANQKVVPIIDGAADLRLPVGRYAVFGKLATGHPDNDLVENITMFSYDVDLSTTDEVVLEVDARKALPLVVDTEKKAQAIGFEQQLVRWLPGWEWPISQSLALSADIGLPRVWTTPYLLTGPELSGTMYLSNAEVSEQPLLDVAVSSSTGRRDLALDAGYATNSPKHVGKLDASLADAGTGTPAELAAANVKGEVALVEARPDVENGSLTSQAQAAADAGAVALVVYGGAPGPFVEQVSWAAWYAGEIPAKALPTLTVSREVGLDLVTRSHERKGGKLIGNGVERPSYQYAFGKGESAVPANLTYRLDAANTAAVDTKVKSFTAEGNVMEEFSIGGNRTRHDFSFEAEGPIDGRTIYYSTFPGATFAHKAQPVSPDAAMTSGFESTRGTYTAGTQLTETYAGQVHHGGLFQDPERPEWASVYRDGESLGWDLPYRVDGDGHAQDWGPDLDTESQFNVWIDDQLVVDSDYANGSGTAPAEEHTYKMQLNTKRDTDWWTQSTDVTTEWTFRSGWTDAATALPLLQLDYGVQDLGPLNEAGRKIDLDLAVSHQDGSTGGAIGGAKLWSSFDAGATWQEVRVKPGQGEGAFSARIHAPNGVEKVSLRSEAWDGAGSTFSETVIDAIDIASKNGR